METVRQGDRLPPIELLKFDGNPLEYAEFVKNFSDHVEKAVTDSSLRLTRLLALCQGKAKEAIRSCVNLPANISYETAKATLHENFGQPYMVANAHIRKRKELRVKRTDAASLMEFSRALENSLRALSSLGKEYVSRLDNEDLLKALMRKLPNESLIKGWCETAGELICHNKMVGLKHFVDFVYKAGCKLNNPYAEELNQTKSVVTTVTQCNRGPQNEMKSYTDRPTCVTCEQSHAIWNCPTFKGMNVESRWKVVRRHKLCIRCLKSGHVISTCKLRFVCRHPGCSRSHNTLLHSSFRPEFPRNQNERDSANMPRSAIVEPNENPDSQILTNPVCVKQVSCLSNMDEIQERDKICFKIVPILVKGTLKEVQTYAFMDSGSDATMCLESLLDEAGVKSGSTTFDYNIQTISGSNYM